MERFYLLIAENPGYFTWAFGLVNVFWLLFVYFNKQSHDKTLIHLKQDLSNAADRKNRFYSLKAEQYENYVIELDSLNKKYQVDILERIMPLFSDLYDGDVESNLSSFMSEVMAITQESSVDYAKLKWSSNKFKLTATDEMLEVLDILEDTHKESMSKVLELLKGFLSMSDAQKEHVQTRLKELGLVSEANQKKLIMLMRNDLR